MRIYGVRRRGWGVFGSAVLVFVFSSAGAAERAPATESPAVVTPKESRARTVRGNEPLTPGQQAATVDSEDVFSRTWRGFRRNLAALGVQIEPVYKGEFASPLAGGVGRNSDYLGNFDLKVAVNAETLVGWTGGSVFLYALGNHGGRPNTRIGSAQGVTNIETVSPAFKLYEAWVQQAFADEKVTFLVGMHDLNSEFYVTESSSLFLNPSFGIGAEFAQTGANGPSIFPTAALAARARYEPVPQFYLETAVFNAVSGDPTNPRGTHIALSSRDGTLSISEAAYLPGRQTEGALQGKYGIGIWGYSSTFPHQTRVDANGDPAQDTNHGIYFLAEQSVSENVQVFARFGKASSSVNQLSSCLSSGAVITGVVPGRSEDRFGIAFTQARNGSEYREAGAAAGTLTETAETTIETTYRVEMKRGVAIQFDHQFVKNPGMNPSIENAHVGLTRFEIAF